MESLAKIKPMVTQKRMKMPRLGTRKLYYLLQDEIKQAGIKIGRDGLFSYLRWENMLVKPAKNYTVTTHSKHWLRKYPNLYLDCVVTRPEQVFVSDITYVKSKERTHYLSLVTDAFSRKIMGYELSDDMSSENVAKALSMAIRNRKTNLPLIHHSDRGLQYCS
jgi:transposase InsO family protein